MVEINWVNIHRELGIRKCSIAGKGERKQSQENGAQSCPGCHSPQGVLGGGSWLLGASVPAFRQCFSLQLVLFLLLKPLYYLLSLPLLSLFHPFERVDFGQLQHHSSACETCPSSWQWLTLMADKQTWESCVLHRSFIRLSLTGVIEV